MAPTMAHYLNPRRHPPSRKGSMANVPKALMDQVHALEKIFTVDTNKLHQITDHFQNELTKGLTKEGGDIPMNPTWVIGYPTGEEQGTYLAIDMGGTNLRVCEVELGQEAGEFEIFQSKYHIPEKVKTSSADMLFDYIAECVKSFLITNHENETLDEIKDLALGFTFSYPCQQNAIDHGVLQRWTKGFDVPGVEGQDVVPMFEAALERKGVPIKIAALVNDTTGTLIASAYTDPQTRIGCIFGTGCNAAYMEDAKNIPKLAHLNLDPELPIAINCEWGAFDNDRKVLPRTVYDQMIDDDSPRPGQQTFEKMVAGLYLGEIFRLVLVDLHDRPEVGLFGNQNIDALRTPYSLDSSFLSKIEEDQNENLTDCGDLLRSSLKIEASEPELKLVRRLAELIGLRAARLSACGVAAICKKKGITDCHVGADGSVFNKYIGFPERQAAALREIFRWDSSIKEDPIQVVGAEDGSGVGAALIAALTVKRVRKGIDVGISVERKNSLLPH